MLCTSSRNRPSSKRGLRPASYSNLLSANCRAVQRSARNGLARRSVRANRVGTNPASGSRAVVHSPAAVSKLCVQATPFQSSSSRMTNLKRLPSPRTRRTTVRSPPPSAAAAAARRSSGGDSVRVRTPVKPPPPRVVTTPSKRPTASPSSSVVSWKDEAERPPITTSSSVPHSRPRPLGAEASKTRPPAGAVARLPASPATSRRAVASGPLK
mmetsp:Transcript_47799/g.150158  ORF Transcript_47799/g.150158 Transcript_47799/m.150158 type:complete len:212 (+) Transcript_47799:98-733(+)